MSQELVPGSRASQLMASRNHLSAVTCLLQGELRSLTLQPPSLSVNDTPLSLVFSVKYLGIQISSDLSWSPHSANVCAKARKLIGVLYRRFYKHANYATLLQLYKSFFRLHLENCSIVWDPLLIKDKEALEKVQRFGLRMCLKNWSLDREQLLQLSNVADRCSQAKLCHLFKIINDLLI